MFLIILQCGVHLLNSNRHLQTGLSQQDFEVEKLSLGLEKCVSSMCVREREREGKMGFFLTVWKAAVCCTAIFTNKWLLVCCLYFWPLTLKNSQHFGFVVHSVTETKL